MLTSNMTGPEVLAAARKARAKMGPGVNESIPMTPRKPCGLSKEQLRRDSEIAKELIYLADVVNRPDMLLAAYYDNRERLSPQRFWEFLKLCWIRAGTIETLPVFRDLFASKKPWKLFLMSPEEEAELASLPESFTIWRAPRPGTVHKLEEKPKGAGIDDALNANDETIYLSDGGISWSISPVFVTEYAKKNGREVVHKTVWKSYATAYFNRRGEGEIILL